jgi:hypothetical protein
MPHESAVTKAGRVDANCSYYVACFETFECLSTEFRIVRILRLLLVTEIRHFINSDSETRRHRSGTAALFCEAFVPDYASIFETTSNMFDDRPGVFRIASSSSFISA